MGKKARLKRERKEEAVGINVSSYTAVVPVEHAGLYLEVEVLSEGRWRDNVPLIVMLPWEERGRGGSEWAMDVLEDMQEVRRFDPPEPLDVGADRVDIGLIDVVVTLTGPPIETMVKLWKQDPMSFFQENARHIDMLLGPAMHDQMVYAAASHIYLNDGSHEIHFHNLLFNLRKEIRDGEHRIGRLDLLPVLERLKTRSRLFVSGGLRPGLSERRPPVA